MVTLATMYIFRKIKTHSGSLVIDETTTCKSVNYTFSASHFFLLKYHSTNEKINTKAQNTGI